MLCQRFLEQLDLRSIDVIAHGSIFDFVFLQFELLEIVHNYFNDLRPIGLPPMCSRLSAEFCVGYHYLINR